MKRATITLLIVLSLLLCLTACGGGGSNADNANDETQPAAPKNDDVYKPLELVESQTVVDRGYIHVFSVIHNPNTGYAVEFPVIRVTAKDTDGMLLGTYDQTLSIVYPEQDFISYFMMCDVDEEPAEIKVELIEPADYGINKTAKLEHPEYIPLEVVNPIVREEKALCEIHNPNDYDIDMAVVFIVFRDSDGNIVGGDETFADDIAAGGSVPVEINIYGERTENAEFYVNLW